MPVPIKHIKRTCSDDRSSQVNRNDEGYNVCVDQIVLHSSAALSSVAKNKADQWRH